MAKTSQLVGVILLALGIVGYVASDMASPTALIPAFFGFVLSGLGYYGRHEHTSKTAMHLAMGVALVGILGSVRGLWGLAAMVSGGVVERPVAVVSQSVMAVVLIWYLMKGIQSFRQARR
jgi:preprotein translocase subunit Sss1